MTPWRNTNAWLDVMFAMDHCTLDDFRKARRRRDQLEYEFLCNPNVTGMDTFHLCVPGSWE